MTQPLFFYAIFAAMALLGVWSLGPGVAGAIALVVLFVGGLISLVVIPVRAVWWAFHGRAESGVVRPSNDSVVYALTSSYGLTLAIAFVFGGGLEMPKALMRGESFAAVAVVLAVSFVSVRERVRARSVAP